MSRYLRSALLALTLALPLSAGESPRPTPPRGFYLLSSRDIPVDRMTFAPFLSGYALRIAWRDLEPTQGHYSFDTILKTVTFLQERNLRLTIEILTSKSPDYVIQNATGTFQVRQGTAPLPWDEFAQTRWKALLQALAELPTPDVSTSIELPLRDHPTLTTLEAPVIGLQAIRDMRRDLVRHPGYTREKFLDAVETSVRTSRQAFPHDYGFTAFFLMSDGNSAPSLDEAVFQRLQTNFMGPRNAGLGLFQELWSDEGPKAGTLGYFLKKVRPPDAVLLQSLTSWKRPFIDASKVASGNPDEAIRKALNQYGCRYFELYYPDTLATDLQPIFTRWAEQLSAPETEVATSNE